MITFKDFLVESQGANKHLEHIEDEVLNGGFDGVKKAITYLSSLGSTLKGSSSKKITITTKWDGAPAIVAGIDPESGKFFVATKHGAFSKVPKLNFSNEDIDNNHEGGLQDVLKDSLKYLKDIGIDGVYQGDLLYSPQKPKTIETIDGESHIVFTPNTITYAIKTRSELGKRINSSKLGIVWHTKYTGEVVNQMNASFDVNVDNFTQTSDVWFKDAEYEKMDGIASFTQEETEKYFNVLSMAGRMFRGLNKKLLDGIKDDKYLNTQIKAFANFKIRQGMPIGNVNSHVVGLIRYLQNKLDKEVDKLKSVRGKENRRKKNEDILKFFTGNKTALKNMFQMQNILIAAKMIIIKKLQDIQPMTKTFIQTDKGFEITNPEGFVAVTLDDGAVKLVDRLEFSRQNFLAPKTFGSKA
jgi:hypothetical protein